MEASDNTYRISANELMKLKRVQEEKNVSGIWDEDWWSKGVGSQEYERNIKIINSEIITSALFQKLEDPSKENLCDLQIIVEDGCVPVHRAVLRGKSPFLDSLLKDGYQEHIPGERGIGTITLTEVEGRHVVPVIHLLYSGEASVSIEDERGMLDVLRMLQIEQIMKIEKQLYTTTAQAGNYTNSEVYHEEIQPEGVDDIPSAPAEPQLTQPEVQSAFQQPSKSQSTASNSSTTCLNKTQSTSKPHRREGKEKIVKMRGFVRKEKTKSPSVSPVADGNVTHFSAKIQPDAKSTRIKNKDGCRGMTRKVTKAFNPRRAEAGKETFTKSKRPLGSPRKKVLPSFVQMYEKDDDFIPCEDLLEKNYYRRSRSYSIRCAPPPGFFIESELGSTYNSNLKVSISASVPSCPFCPSTFSVFSSLDLHLNTHPSCGKEIRGYFNLTEKHCKACNMKFDKTPLPRFLEHVSNCVTEKVRVEKRWEIVANKDKAV